MLGFSSQTCKSAPALTPSPCMTGMMIRSGLHQLDEHHLVACRTAPPEWV